MMLNRVEQWVAMYTDEKKSLRQIAESVSVPISTVRRALLAAGVKMRTPLQGQITRGVFGKHLIGTKRPHTPRTIQRIKLAAKRRAEHSAKGTRITPDGYVEFTRGPHKGRSVHVVKMEKKIGRRLKPDECVHHRDENRQNNSLNNLKLMTRAEHARLHRKLQSQGSQCHAQ